MQKNCLRRTLESLQVTYRQFRHLLEALFLLGIAGIESHLFSSSLYGLSINIYIFAGSSAGKEPILKLTVYANCKNNLKTIILFCKIVKIEYLLHGC